MSALTSKAITEGLKTTNIYLQMGELCKVCGEISPLKPYIISVLSTYFKKYDKNHHRPPQKTQLRPFFSESLTLQGFQTAKNRVFSLFLLYFLHILEALPISFIVKKRRNPYIYCVLEPYHFFP